jgi:hypothetical protein
MLEKGHRICVTPGCRFPLVIREHLVSGIPSCDVVDGQPTPGYELVSWCYVREYMRDNRLDTGLTRIVLY